ncbi:MAG: hypothetical protein AAGH64_03545 [Planctomycetota bacterium]
MPTIVRTVALLHTLPDGSSHVDWMWSPGPGPYDDDERVLATFRLPAIPARCGGSFEAIRIHDHRARYLWYEGDIGRGLGSVRRLWGGPARVWAHTPDRFDIEIVDDGALVRVDGRATENASSSPTIFRCTAQRVGVFDGWPIGPRAEQE